MNLLSYILFLIGFSGGLGGPPPIVGRAPEAITSSRPTGRVYTPDGRVFESINVVVVGCFVSSGEIWRFSSGGNRTPDLVFSLVDCFLSIGWISRSLFL